MTAPTDPGFALTGWGTFSLGITDLPPFDSIDGYQFLGAIAIGVLGAVAV